MRFINRQSRARPLACFAGAFLLGILAADRLRPSPAVCAGAIALVAVAGLALWRTGKRRALAWLLIPAALAAGLARMSLALAGSDTVDTRYSAQMVGRVDSEPFLNPDTGRLIFKLHLEQQDGEPCDLRLRLYLRGDEAMLREIAYGQRIAFVGHIWKPDPVTNPWEFDFGAFLIRNGLRGYATAKIEDVQVLEQTRDLRSSIIAARSAIARRIDALFPKSAAMMRALVLGDRSMLGDELRASLNRSGTAHLISISGLHVTVLSAMLAMLLGCFMTRRRAILLAIALLLPYGALIGFSAPFVRALAMFAILGFAPVVGHPSDSITRLCAVLLAYLVVSPLNVEDAGFVLSFTASAGIILLTPPLQRLIGIDKLRTRRPSPSRLRRAAFRLALYLPELLCASLAAQLATLPAVVAMFGVQSVVALPFNLVCVPLCMLGYVCGLVALLLSAVSMALASLLAVLPDTLFAWMIDITRFGAGIPAASVRIGRYPTALVFAHWAIVLAASELSRVRASLRRFMPFALILVAAVSSLIPFARAWSFSVVFLDAGQADCAILRSRGHTYMIDVGDTYTPAADYLNATCLHLDGIVLSHPHQDHAGGLSSVLASFRPDAIYVPAGWFEVHEPAPSVSEGIQLARDMGVEIRELSAGDALRLSGEAQLSVWAPAAGARELPSEINDMSLMALVECQGQGVLFTGDTSIDAEPEAIPDTDILKVAHHGSNKATSERFLSACTPDIAVISVGENNYGHPSQETLDKLADVGAQVYLTRDCGAITLTHLRDGWHIKTTLEASHAVE